MKYVLLWILEILAIGVSALDKSTSVKRKDDLKSTIISKEIHLRKKRQAMLTEGTGEILEEDGVIRWGTGFELPSGTHCDKRQRTGSLCCSGIVSDTIQEVMYELSASPQFGRAASSVIANAIQFRIQQRLHQSFEVFVFTSDFAVASYSVADEACRFTDRGFEILAYSTPRQYDVHSPFEPRYGMISNNEPLGGEGRTLPGMRTAQTIVQLEGGAGPRSQYPRGSHCDERRSGSRCCSLALFNIMQRSFETVRSQNNFDPYDLRSISRAMQWQSEEMFQNSFEVIISRDDFIIASSYGDNLHCKYDIDEYYVAAYASPIQYPIHQDIYADNGFSDPVDCLSTANIVNVHLIFRYSNNETNEYSVHSLSILCGTACCDGYLRYEICRAIDEASPEYGWNNTDYVAEYLQQAVHNRFNGTYETIVARADFVWATHLYTQQACKITVGGYHALAYQSSPYPPEFFAPPEFPLEAQIIQPPPIQQFVPFQPVQAVQLVQPPLQPIAPAYYPAVVPGAGGLACFSQDTWVTTPDGKKRMDEIKPGDFVLSANSTHVFYVPVLLWMHREPNAWQEFVTLMTEYGKMLALTRKHLIFRKECDEYYDEYVDSLPESTDAVYAEELKVGDCITLLYKGRFRQQRLMEITYTIRRGIFAPLTPNGRIFVNDIIASCYSDFNKSTLQLTFFSLTNTVRAKLSKWIGLVFDNEVELPYGTELTTEILKLILPFKK